MSDIGVVWADPTLYRFRSDGGTVYEHSTAEQLGAGRPMTDQEIAGGIRRSMVENGGTCLCVVRDGLSFVGIGQHLNPPAAEVIP